MIKNFKHKGLELFFIQHSKRFLDARDVSKITRILDLLDAATFAKDLNIPSWDLHELKGDRKGTWSVTLRKNWKITFRIIDGEVLDVNLEDYH